MPLEIIEKQQEKYFVRHDKTIPLLVPWFMISVRLQIHKLVSGFCHNLSVILNLGLATGR